MINRKLHISALMETDSYSYTWSIQNTYSERAIIGYIMARTS